ncbi:MAG: SDR family NAD(P)-dependent oxidoreductase [Firmicutes bacterium]|nr:SDR family NAD(P)-dependent oxidoreductase [Bacillota bacterium]
MENKVVVITGASSGIGAALAEKLGGAGHSVVLAARSEDKLREIAEKIGENALAVKTDVTVKSDMENLKNRALEKFGRIDVWINNAGRGVGKTWTAIPEEDVDEIFDINFKSAYYGVQAVIPYFMKQKKGHLINVSSFLGKVPFAPFRSAYNAAKSAVNSMTSNLRIELKVKCPEIKITTILPGPVSTDFHKNALGGTPPFAGPGSTPVKFQTPEEVADVIIEAMRNPKAEVFTQPEQIEQVLQYMGNVEAFEEHIAGIIKSGMGKG